MKYNPRLNEELARLPGLAQLHPLQPADQVQGALALMWQLEQALIAVTGLARVTLQPAAGAHGELAGMLMIRKALQARGERRRKVLIPDSAHGTNPASAVFAGFETVEIASTAKGTLDLAASAASRRRRRRRGAHDRPCPTPWACSSRRSSRRRRCCTRRARSSTWTAPTSTRSSASRCRARWASTRSTSTCTRRSRRRTAAAARAPGRSRSRPALVPYLPVPTVEKVGDRYALIDDRPDSIGKVRGFFGNFGMLRAGARLHPLARAATASAP